MKVQYLGFDPTWDSATWFNISGPGFTLNRTHIRLWNLFNRRTADRHYWGAGILQINHRHLFCIAFSGVSVLFIGRIP